MKTKKSEWHYIQKKWAFTHKSKSTYFCYGLKCVGRGTLCFNLWRKCWNQHGSSFKQWRHKILTLQRVLSRISSKITNIFAFLLKLFIPISFLKFHRFFMSSLLMKNNINVISVIELVKTQLTFCPTLIFGL